MISALRGGCRAGPRPIGSPAQQAPALMSLCSRCGSWRGAGDSLRALRQAARGAGYRPHGGLSNPTRGLRSSRLSGVSRIGGAPAVPGRRLATMHPVRGADRARAGTRLGALVCAERGREPRNGCKNRPRTAWEHPRRRCKAPQPGADSRPARRLAAGNRLPHPRQNPEHPTAQPPSLTVLEVTRRVGFPSLVG